MSCHGKNTVERALAPRVPLTFRVNIFSMFYLARFAMAHLKSGAVIINTASITAFAGNPKLSDYSSTKGGIVSAKSLVTHLRGLVWTPLIPSSFEAEDVAKFGAGNPRGKLHGSAAKADEISPCFVFLATEDSAFVTGQIIHANGGEYFASPIQTDQGRVRNC